MTDLANRAYVQLWTRLRREDGQTFVEYALIGVLVAVVVATALLAFTGKITTALTDIENAFGLKSG